MWVQCQTSAWQDAPKWHDWADADRQWRPSSHSWRPVATETGYAGAVAGSETRRADPQQPAHQQPTPLPNFPSLTECEAKDAAAAKRVARGWRPANTGSVQSRGSRTTLRAMWKGVWPYKGKGKGKDKGTASEAAEEAEAPENEADAEDGFGSVL